jgi:pimeloyl-ACP methyl ester carboxylesterase
VSNDNGARFATSKDGTRIAYYVDGDGPPLVMVYGALSERKFWNRLLPYFDGFTRYIVERRGRGESGDGATYHPDREAEDVVAVIEAIEGQVDVFAHSSGAVVALAAMQMAPHHIRRAVLYEPPMYLDHGLRTFPSADFPAQVQARLDEGNVGDAMEFFYRHGPNLPEADIQRQKGGDLWRSLEPLAHTMVYDAQVPQFLGLERLSAPVWAVPTLLLFGEVSPDWVVDGVKTLAANLGSSQIRVLPKQGHVAMFTAPELLASEVKAFLQVSDARTRS